MIATELYQVSKLRSVSGEQIVEQHARETQMKFEQAAEAGHVLPVILRVRDEQEDLPATLLALSRSQRPVVPIVASNGSVDDTVEIAKRMVGADNVIDMKEPGLMGAMQEGVRHAQHHYGTQTMLMTDGDTLMPARWAGNMERKLEKTDTGNGAFLNGRVIWAHGNRRSVDAAVTAKAVWHITKSKITHRQPGPLGANQGIRFDPEGRTMDALLSLEPTIFVQEDFAVRDAMMKAGAAVSAPLSPAIVGITRGDRYATLRDVFVGAPQSKARHLQSYQQQYGKNVGRYTR